MRPILLVLLLLLEVSRPIHAQNFDEWFRQKKTQIKYLKQQIAGLQAYIGYIQTGYSIARDGLHLISDIKNGDLNLHAHYFNSLRMVNPLIKKDARVALIIAQAASIRQIALRIHSITSGTAREKQYTSTVLYNLLINCERNLEELTTLLTVSMLEMKDDERLNRIGQLFIEMQDMYGFIRQFSIELGVLQIQRGKENKDLNTTRALHGLN